MNNGSIHRRRGLAPIELLMSLPLMAVLFLMVLTISFAGVLAFKVTVQARTDAWQTANRPPVPEATWSRLIQAANWREDQRQFSPDVVTAQAEGQLKCGIEAMTDELPPVTRHCKRLRGTWAQQTIRFAEESDHPRLLLEPALKEFSVGRFDPAVFQRLLPQAPSASKD